MSEFIIIESEYAAHVSCREEAVLCLGIAALALFIRSHWTGPPLDEETLKAIKRLENQASPDAIRKDLVIEDTVLSLVQHPELLLFALKVFEFSLDLGYDTTVSRILLHLHGSEYFI